MSDPANQNEPIPPANLRPVDVLIKQYVEDRGSLAPEELDRLIEALRAQPALAIELRTQLLVDDLLAQKLALDRRNFLAQVGQRIGDFEQGEEEIYSQVSELRALAEAELVERPKSAGGTWKVGLIALLASAAAVLAVLAPQYWPISPRQVATVEAVSGEAYLSNGATRTMLSAGDSLSTGTPIVVAAGGTLKIEYRDQTTVQFAGGSKVTLVADRKTQAKLVQFDQGELVANVAPQKDVGSMIFTTPQARATVLGTEFRLIVSPESTRLDVTEGRVDFQRLAGGEPLLVAANQSGVADATKLVLRDLQWPEWREKALFVLHGDKRESHVRKADSKDDFWSQELAARGPAHLVGGTNVYSFNGGNLYSEEAGGDLVANIRDAGKFTIETVIIPDAIFRVQNARVFSLGDDDKNPNFHLLQRGSDLVFRMWTDGSSETNGPVELKLGSVKPDRPVHVTISYDGTELTGYLDGESAGKVKVEESGLSTWNSGAFALGSDAAGHNVWRGTICDLVIADTALAAVDVKQSAGQYQTLFARRDAGLMWDNLMSKDLDPSQFAGAGNWQLVDDSWQNSNAEDAWFGLGPENLKNYDLLVDVNWVEGDGPLKLTLPVDQRPVAVVLGKRGGEQKSSLTDMGGGPMPGAGSVESDHALPQGRTARLEVKVRLQKGVAQLSVIVDGEAWLEWEGSPDKLPAEVTSPMPVVKKPILVAAGNVVRIEALKIRDLSGTGAIGQ